MNDAVLYFLYVAGLMLLALAVGFLGVWAWTARKKHPRTSRTIRWLLAVYLLLGALGWGLLLTSEIPVRHPEWFGWTEAPSAAEDAP